MDFWTVRLLDFFGIFRFLFEVLSNVLNLAILNLGSKGSFYVFFADFGEGTVCTGFFVFGLDESCLRIEEFRETCV